MAPAPRLLLPDPRLTGLAANRTHSPTPQPQPQPPASGAGFDMGAGPPAQGPTDPRSRPSGTARGAPPTDPRRAVPLPIAASTQPVDPRVRTLDPQSRPPVPGPWPPPGDPVPALAPQAPPGDPRLRPELGQPLSVSTDVPSDPRQRRQQPNPPHLAMHPPATESHIPFASAMGGLSGGPLQLEQRQHLQQQPFVQAQLAGQSPQPMVSTAAKQPRPPPGAPLQGPPPQQIGRVHPGLQASLEPSAGQQQQQQPPRLPVAAPPSRPPSQPPGGPTHNRRIFSEPYSGQQQQQPSAGQQQHGVPVASQQRPNPPAKKLTLAEEVASYSVLSHVTASCRLANAAT